MKLFGVQLGGLRRARGALDVGPVKQRGTDDTHANKSPALAGDAFDGSHGVAMPELLRRFPGADGPSPHAGLSQRSPPWDLEKLAGAGDDVAAAFARYLEPDFIELPPTEKTAVLDTLAPVLFPGALDELRKFHLPRTVAGTDKPITTAIESESHSLATLFRFYAPDPSGKLDERALTPELRKKLLAAPRTPLAQRFPDDAFLKGLRWKDLPLALQKQYLVAYGENVDPKMTMHRITDPRVTPDGQVAPGSLQKTLKWERELRLQIGELITDGSYASQDQRVADRTWITSHFGQQGFHMHGVAELSTPEDKARLGPKLAAFAALQDLSLFADAAAVSHQNYTLAFLEPWQAESAGAVASSFVDKDGGGKIDGDEILPHKFHFVGMRTGIYGDDNRVGVEIRGVSTADPAKFDHVCARFEELLSGGNIEKLPTPPWEGWNAGEPGISKELEADTRAYWHTLTPEHQAFEQRAEMSFDDIFAMCTAGAGSKNGFAFESPLWSYESIPGLTDVEKQTIDAARKTFCNEMVRFSVGLSELIESGRDTKEIEASVHTWVSTAAMEFFASAGIHAALERVLDETARA